MKKHKATVKIDIVKKLTKELIKSTEGKVEVPKHKNTN